MVVSRILRPILGQGQRVHQTGDGPHVVSHGYVGVDVEQFATSPVDAQCRHHTAVRVYRQFDKIPLLPILMLAVVCSGASDNPQGLVAASLCGDHRRWAGSAFCTLVEVVDDAGVTPDQWLRGSSEDEPIIVDGETLRVTRCG